MANDLSVLEPKLALKLFDSTHAVWTLATNQDVLTWACARLWPRVARTLQETVTLVDNQDQYTLTTVADISRVDVIDPNSTPANVLVNQLMGGTWEWWGDHETVGGTLYLNPQFADASYKLRVHGYAPYNLTNSSASTNPPDRFVQAILSMAAAEQIRRMMTDRAKFKQWEAISQNTNVTVNELLNMVNEGDADFRQLVSEFRTQRRPRPAFR